MKKILQLVLALSISGCAIWQENSGESSESNTRSIAAYWWSNDDAGGYDSVYAEFFFTEETPSKVAYVDFTCRAGEAASTTFDGMGRGDFQYRASVRVVVEVAGTAYPVPGAQKYVTPTDGSGIIPVTMSGVLVVPEDGQCRAILYGKAFTGTLELFGAGSLIVNVSEPASQ